MTYQTLGYSDLELSTQIIIKEAVRRQVDVKVIDQLSNTIKLSKDGVEELVMQATRTSKDTYISPMLMSNKHVTKKMLHDAGIKVPGGYVAQSMDMAIGLFEQFAGKALVIKPLSTNHGIGIHILEAGYSFKQFEDAMKEAFTYDQQVIVEAYLPGKEYRILVIDGRVIGVLNREPANVIGDGYSTIEALVFEKNKDERRGDGYEKPLVKIQLGEAELEVLSTQALGFQSIPDKGVKVWLRKNSNISTGGDSIDYTDELHKKYQELALKAAEVMGAKICGIDMIIEDVTQFDESGYGIIEMNYNPAIFMHQFPAIGKSRDVGKVMLDLLGF